MLGCLCRGEVSVVNDELSLYQLAEPDVVYITIDTGAVRTVFPKNWAPVDVPIQPTKSSRRGDFYWGAGSENIYDLGGQVVTLDIEEYDEPQVLRGAVCHVRMPLASALELRNAGWHLCYDYEYHYDYDYYYH